jgi:hypothetical protein
MELEIEHAFMCFKYFYEYTLRVYIYIYIIIIIKFFLCDPISFAICTSKIINKLTINQASARTIAMGASGNTGLPTLNMAM